MHAGHSEGAVYTISEPTGSASQYWLDKTMPTRLHLTVYQGTLCWTNTIFALR